MWGKVVSRLQRLRRDRIEGRPRSNAFAPVALIVAVAIACIVVAVYSSAHRADEVQLAQERQLFAYAIADRGRRVVHELENVAASDDVTLHLNYNFDPEWVHRRVGQRLTAFFDHEHVLALDATDRFTYALLGSVSVDPSWFEPYRPELNRIIELLRGRQLPRSDETMWSSTLDVMSGIGRPRRAQLLQTFMGRPAIVVGVASELLHLAAPADKGPPPLLLSVKFIDGPMLTDIGVRFNLPDLHKVDHESPMNKGEHLFVVANSLGQEIARFAWMPNQPGTKIVGTVLPFIGVALGAFALLAGLALRYMRRTAATIAESEDRMRHLALHDALSGLPNRTYFGERLAATIEEVARNDSSAALLAIDLDHFKDVNDTLGHHVGDGLIKGVAQRLIRALRSDDLVARLGGDEFAVIVSQAPDLETLESLAIRLNEVLRAPYGIMGHTLVIGASIGIAMIDKRSSDAADIMRRADVALYRAKNEGRNRACIYDADMDASLRERKQLELDLYDAITNNGLSIAYQPLVSPSGDKMVAVEALCRWKHPERGEIPPVEFIPVAERSELIIPLGEWVLRHACLEAKNWDGVILAVNVSPLQFRRQDFVDVVERIMSETGFDPKRLELELTESTLLGNTGSAESAMLRLKALGVRLALDDFGTGYSSLSYLRRFPFDKIKIDRSFVRAIETTADSASIIHAIVSLGRGLGMKVTAEGVETAEQQLFLRAAGVHTMQGYRFGRPMPADQIMARISGSARAANAPAALAG